MKLDKKQSGVPGIVNLPDPAPGKGGRKVVALALLAVVVPLLALFIYVVLRSGPMAPVAVTLATVESQALTPALFGVGTVGTRTSTKIGPTVAGRLLRLDVDVGDRVRAGQVLGEMDRLDLEDRLQAQDAAVQLALINS